MGALTLQLERPGSFLELDGKQLRHYAESLASAWVALGVRPGDRVLVYDYGASPAALLASSAFVPYLERGAAEATSSQVICVDGLTGNASRVAHVLRYFKPHWLFARADTVPLLVSGPTVVPAEDRGARLVATCDGELPAQIDRRQWQNAWSGGVGYLCRWDPCAFIAPECPECGHLQVPPDLYEAGVDHGQNGHGGWGMLEVEPRFVPLGPATTAIEARMALNSGCCGENQRFEAR